MYVEIQDMKNELFIRLIRTIKAAGVIQLPLQLIC